jgi:hypothetical protein
VPFLAGDREPDPGTRPPGFRQEILSLSGSRPLKAWETDPWFLATYPNGVEVPQFVHTESGFPIRKVPTCWEWSPPIILQVIANQCPSYLRGRSGSQFSGRVGQQSPGRKSSGVRIVGSPSLPRTVVVRDPLIVNSRLKRFTGKREDEFATSWAAAWGTFPPYWL